jgi:hypothetical protein
MFTSLFLASALVSGGVAPQPTAAQAAMNAAIAQAEAPADCLKALQTFVSGRQEEVRATPGFTADLLKEVTEEKVFLARTCLARIGPSSVKGAQLPALAELYIEAGKPDEGNKAMTRALAEPMSPADRAAALAAAITVTLREPKGEARDARVETFVTELDANTAATLDQKLAAHGGLLDYYRGEHIDAGIIKHTTWLAATAKGLTQQERRKFGAQIAKLLADK